MSENALLEFLKHSRQDPPKPKPQDRKLLKTPKPDLELHFSADAFMDRSSEANILKAQSTLALALKPSLCKFLLLEN